MSTGAPPQPVTRRSTAVPPSHRSATPERQRAHYPALSAFGNQLVQRRLKADRIQTQSSLRVTDPDDELEREADSVAQAVMDMSEPRPAPTVGFSPGSYGIQRQADDEERRRKAAGPAPVPPKPAQPPKLAAPVLKPPPPRPEPPKTMPPPPLVPQPPERDPQTLSPEERQRELERREDEAVARKPDSTGVPEVASETASTIRAQAGAGQPLGTSERSFFEPRLGHDLSSVRIHDDATAARTAEQLRARAFTHGSDVYLASGAPRAGSTDRNRLLAHELAHTIQQRPGATLQRLPDPPPPQGTGLGGSGPGGGRPNPTTTPESTGRLIPAQGEQGSEVVFSTIAIPAFKFNHPDRKAAYDAFIARRGGVRRRRAYDSHNPRAWAADVWREQLGAAARSAPAQAKLAAKLATRDQPPGQQGEAPNPAGPWVFKDPGRGNTYYIGSLPEVAGGMVLPLWNRYGRFPQGGIFEADHLVDTQLGDWGPNPDSETNKAENMELLGRTYNNQAGNVTKRAIHARVEGFLGQVDTSNPDHHLASKDDVLQHHDVVFRTVVASDQMTDVPDGAYFLRREIETDALNVDHAVISSLSEVDPGAGGGESNRVRLFKTRIGGAGKLFRISATPVPPLADERDWLKPYVITQKQFAPGTANFGKLWIETPAGSKIQAPPDFVTFSQIPGTGFAGFSNDEDFTRNVRRWSVEPFSPVEIGRWDLTERGLLVEGTIRADLPLLRGSGIGFRIEGTDLALYKEFTVDDIHVPPPLRVPSCTLTISAGTESGFAVAGRVDLVIDRLGQGYLEARAGTVTGFALEGGFDFDTRMFTEASIRMRYENRELSGEGTLGIGPGKIPGIRRARIHAAYAQERITADGTADLTIPGVESGAMTFSYSEAEGMAVGGTFQLSNRIPGIRGGSIQARVAELADRTGYSVTAHGEAQPAIPGVDARLTVDYADGAITVAGRAAYSRGFLSGELEVGATNRPVDPAGNPLPDAPPTDRLTAFGGGQVTVRMTPWLQGTVGLRLLGNGEVEISGEIGLPASLEVFPRRSYDRNIFTIGLDIPIVGVAVAGQRVGIFATIQGGLDFSAGVGPGTLQQLRVGITYNPAHEDQTHLTGDAEFVIPADAGLRLFVRGGIGAGIPLVSATAGLELGGRLGLEGAARAGVHLDWTPARGLVLDAEGEIFVEPRFRFDITGFVLVEAGIWGLTVELYSKRWELAALEYGSGLRLGMRFPIHYEEGQPFDLDWNRVEFQIPDVDPEQVLTGLIEQIT